MRIEGYLFVEWRGQQRFGIEMFAHDIGPALKSKQAYDRYWDITTRQRPTLHELTDDYSVKIKAEFLPIIHEGLKEFRRIMTISPKGKFKKEFEGGYVEFVNIG